jgi:hypothetical protein
VGELLWNTSNPSGAFQLENFGPVSAAGTYDLGFGSATGAGGIGGATLETCDGQFYGGSGHYPASIDFYWSSTSGTLTPIGSAISVPLEDGDYALENVWTDPVPSNAVTVFVVIPSVSESPTFYVQYSEFTRPDTTSTVITATPSGSNLVLEATVTSTYYTACPSSGNYPTGNVQFYVNGSPVGSPVALTEVQINPGTSHCSYTVAASGVTLVEAAYAGTASDLASSGSLSLAPTLDVSPATISETGDATISASVTNTGGGGAVVVDVSSNESWLTVSASSVTTPFSGDVATVNITRLTEGTYTGTLSFSNADASNSPQTLVVTLTLAAAVLVASPSSIAAVSPYDPLNPLPITLTIENTGGSMAENVAIGSSVPWVTFDETSIGNIQAGSSATVQIYFNAYGIEPLPSGSNPQNVRLSAILSITSNAAPISVNVTLAPRLCITGALGSGGYGVRQVAQLGPTCGWIW